jgi:hypothetical protein
MCKTDWRPIDGETHNINGQSISQIYSLSRLPHEAFFIFLAFFTVFTSRNFSLSWRFFYAKFCYCSTEQRGKWNHIDRSPIINWSRVPQEGSVFYLAAREKSLDGKCFSLSERELYRAFRFSHVTTSSSAGTCKKTKTSSLATSSSRALTDFVR